MSLNTCRSFRLPVSAAAADIADRAITAVNNRSFFVISPPQLLLPDFAVGDGKQNANGSAENLAVFLRGFSGEPPLVLRRGRLTVSGGRTRRRGRKSPPP